MSKTIPALVSILFTVSTAYARLHIIDEYMSLTGTDVESKNGLIDQLLFVFSLGNGFFLVDDAAPPSGTCLFENRPIKSAGMHAKMAMGLIFDDELFDLDGTLIPSRFRGVFDDDPVARDATRAQGFFYVLPLLGIEPSGHFGADFMRVMMSSIMGLLQTGLDLEIVLRHEGQVLRVLRNDEPGVVFPRDLLYIIDSLPADDSEYLLELRTEFNVAVSQDKQSTAFRMPMKYVTGIHVGQLFVRPCARAPRLTPVQAIVSPLDDLCPCDTEPWWFDGPDPYDPPRDLGESCFDVDYLTDFDFLMMPGGGLGNLMEQIFPSVHHPDFDTTFSGWFAHNALRNSSVRLLDSVNLEPGVPGNLDREPLSDVFTETYDGVPLEVAMRLEYLRVRRRSAQPDQRGLVNRIAFLRAFLGDYSHFRNVRFYVLTANGQTVRVSLPELLQTIAWETWNKAGAYEDGHRLYEDVPYWDRGERSPMRFMLLGSVRRNARWEPVKAIVSAQAGVYLTNLYGGCIFGVEDVCNPDR